MTRKKVQVDRDSVDKNSIGKLPRREVQVITSGFMTSKHFPLSPRLFVTLFSAKLELTFFRKEKNNDDKLLFHPSHRGFVRPANTCAGGKAAR